MKLISSIDVPNNWNELAKLKKVLPFCKPEVARLPEELEFYRLYVTLVPKEIRLEIINKSMKGKNIYFLKNNFPYNRLLQNLPNVKQYCLWSKKEKLSDSKVEALIQEKFPNKEYFWFENSDIIKSVPEIWHCHIFIKE